ncbi:MAG: hypothetical protein ACFFCS_11910 [Candidatus Hodarchaeota archaeon]
MNEDIEEINNLIKNEVENVDYLKGMEIVLESFSAKIMDVFGKNTLLSMLYQIGAKTGEIIAKRIKREHKKEIFEPLEAIGIFFKEVKGFFCVEVKNIEEDENYIRIYLKNHCFFRDAMNNRAGLVPGKMLCRINKGYFEFALLNLVKPVYNKVDMSLVENDEANDCCIECLSFKKAKEEE